MKLSTSRFHASLLATPVKKSPFTRSSVLLIPSPAVGLSCKKSHCLCLIPTSSLKGHTISQANMVH